MVAIAILQRWKDLTARVTANTTAKDENNLPVLQVQNVRFGLLRAVQEAQYIWETRISVSHS